MSSLIRSAEQTLQLGQDTGVKDVEHVAVFELADAVTLTVTV
jgi:hypothetical protein